MLYKVSNTKPIIRILYYSDVTDCNEVLWLISLSKFGPESLSEASIVQIRSVFSHLFINESTLFSYDPRVQLLCLRALSKAKCLSSVSLGPVARAWDSNSQEEYVLPEAFAEGLNVGFNAESLKKKILSHEYFYSIIAYVFPLSTIPDKSSIRFGSKTNQEVVSLLRFLYKVDREFIQHQQALYQ
jgi:hypothetical protein